MHSAEKAQDEAWPEAPPGFNGTSDMPLEEQNRLKDIYLQARRELKAKKEASLPSFSISIAALPSQDFRVPESGHINFTATLTYSEAPEVLQDSDSDGIPVVIALAPKALHPFSDFATRYGQYQVFTQADCAPESRVEYKTTQVTMRRARDKDGRFLPVEERAEDITSEAGWVELKVGESVSRQMEIALLDDPAWGGRLERGKEYWLKYAPPGEMPWQRAEITGWRYGTFESWRGKKFIWDDKNWLPISIPNSNAIKFFLQ